MRKPLSTPKYLTAGLFLAFGATTASLYAQGSATANAIEERASAMQRAQQLMVEGDAAYLEKDFKTAYEAFKGSVDALPEGEPATAVRPALVERYASATIEYSRQLVKVGDVPLATSIVEEALGSDYAGAEHPGLQQQFGYVTDPIRTNAALTPEHAAKVDEVRRLLYTAQAAYDLALFDKAEELYQSVLRLDSYNTAARRGMEQIHLARAQYAGAAYDETRADFLAQVDAAWESRKGLDEVNTDLITQEGLIPLVSVDTPASLADRIILSEVRFDQMTLSEVLEELRILTRENDDRNLPEASKGINFANLGDDAGGLITIDARNLPVSALLNLVAEASGTTWVPGDYVITFVAPDAQDALLQEKTWTVPGDFLTKGALASTGESDPFNTDGGGNTLTSKRLTAKEFLEGQGVTFPEGSDAGYAAGTNRLFVRNTRSNLALVDSIVKVAQSAQPVNLVIKATIVTINQENLEELGYDWLLNTAGRDNVFLGGGSVGNGPDNATFGSTGPRPVTAGNRSGQFSFPDGSIDDLINNESTGFVSSPEKAPGILQLTALGRQQFSVLMRGFDQKKGTDINATPSVVTVPNSKALVESVREFIYPTEYEPPELPNSNLGAQGDFDGPIAPIGNIPITPVTPATPTAFDTRRVGTVLSVEGTLSADQQFISLTVDGSISSFDGFLNYGSPITGGSTTTSFGAPTLANPFGAFQGTSTTSGVLTDNRILMPVFSETAINTSVTLRSGAVLAIGGLSKSSIETVRDGVPLLSDLPLVGRFFKSEGTRNIRDQIIIFITAEVRDPSGRSVTGL